MPKIIKNVREQLLEEAKRQIKENGYEATTVRSVAGGCGLGVGTVYNYFESKEMLIASFMADDWQKFLAQMKKNIERAEDEKAVLRCVYDTLTLFCAENRKLFDDQAAAKVFAAAFNARHRMLREQIAQCIEPLCVKCGSDDPAFAAKFIAESMLTWTTAGKSFDSIFSVIKKLFD